MKLFKRFTTKISKSFFDKNSLSDKIIQVDIFDREIGSISKLDAHLTQTLNRCIVHRAFSLFCIDKNNNILLQKRADSKFTYPLTWSNSVCSHPLFNDLERKTDKHEGVRHAARRRLKEELGIQINDLNAFKHIDTYLYKTHYNEQFGESECSLIS